MRTSLHRWFGSLSVAVFALGVAACAPADEAGLEGDEPSDEQVDEARAEATTYFRLRHDARRCVSPLCGGVWFSRVNRTTTRCLDGAYRAECYAAEADFTALGLDDEARDEFRSSALAGRGLVRARVRSKVFGSFGDLGELVVTEGWRAATDAAATGPVYAVQQNEVTCVRAPCANLDANRVNYNAPTVLHALRLERVAGLDGEGSAAVLAALRDPGVLVAGSVRTRRLRDGSSERGIDATQVYLRVGASVSDAQFCDADAECAMTPYGSPVTNAAECYCPLCPTTAANTSTAEHNARTWQRYCSGERVRCPAVRCARPPELTCRNHACVRAELR